MKNHALISLLKKFSGKEIKEFGDFISVPYFNKRAAVADLYEIIKKQYPDFKEPGIEKKNLFKSLYKRKKFNESSLRVLMHYLYELAVRFLTIKRFEKDKLQYKYMEILEMLDRDHTSGIEKSIDRLIANLRPEDYVSEQFYYHRFKLEYEKMYCLVELHSGIYEKFLESAYYINVFKNLSLYYYLTSLRMYLNILNLEIIYKKDFPKRQFEEMFDSLDISLINEVKILDMYYNMILMIKDQNKPEYFYKVKNILKEISSQLFLDDLKDAYINQLNYCGRKILSGDSSFVKEKFEVCRNEIRSKTYLYSGKMSPVYFKQVVATGLQISEFKWVYDFIHKYKNELERAFRENTFNYSLSLYYFKKKEFDRSLEYLSKVTYNEVYQKIDLKILQMMIYYEMNSTEPLLSAAEAFRHFLTNSKLIPAPRLIWYMNFHKSLARLLKYRISSDKFRLSKLKQEILSTDEIVNKDWFINKISELT